MAFILIEAIFLALLLHGIYLKAEEINDVKPHSLRKQYSRLANQQPNKVKKSFETIS